MWQFKCVFHQITFNPLSTNPPKWSNTLKQVVGKLPTNCLSVFDNFVELALKGLTSCLCQTSYSKVYAFYCSFSLVDVSPFLLVNVGIQRIYIYASIKCVYGIRKLTLETEKH